MGLLKLGSIYKKSKKETTKAVAPPVPIVDPPSLLKLNLNLEEKQQSEKDHPTASATGTLFDDILTELNTEQDAINNDFQLALALSEQLSLEQPSTKKITVSEKSENANSSSFLFGTDSIYSSYLRNMSAIETTTTDSMFDSIMNSKSHSNTNTYQETVSIAQPTTNKVVLDSDISDSDEESIHSVESVKRGKKDGKRMTKGPKPIMERRGPNPNVQRKVDHRTEAEINESVIQRMKDRHRTQAKLTALRQQQQQEEEYNMYNMVPQSYGFPTMVLPQPGFIMDPYYPPPQEMDHYPPNPHYIPNHQLPPMSVPAGFMPIPKHISIAATFKKEDQHEVEPLRMSIQPTKSLSTPTQRANQRYSSRPKFDPSPITSSSTLESIQEHEPMQVPQIRSSRSTPNLKKKNNKKKPKSRALPPPPLRHMKSEPELIERNHNRQQLQNEWERMRQNPYNYQQQQPVVYYPYH